MMLLFPPLKLLARLPAALEHPPNVCRHLVASQPSLDGDLLPGKPWGPAGLISAWRSCHLRALWSCREMPSSGNVGRAEYCFLMGRKQQLWVRRGIWVPEASRAHPTTITTAAAALGPARRLPLPEQLQPRGDCQQLGTVVLAAQKQDKKKFNGCHLDVFQVLLLLECYCLRNDFPLALKGQAGLNEL